jgi:hypothetical protein
MRASRIGEYPQVYLRNGHPCQQSAALAHTLDVPIAQFSPGHPGDGLGLASAVDRDDLRLRRQSGEPVKEWREDRATTGVESLQTGR